MVSATGLINDIKRAAYRIRIFTAHFCLGPPCSSLNFHVTYRCRILDIPSFLKSIVKHNYGGGARGAYLARGQKTNSVLAKIK